MHQIYNVNSATLAKWRFRAKAGLRSLSYEERRAYADAVEKAVLALQRSQLRGATPPEPRPHCASGTWHTTGEAIDAAMKAKHRAALAAAPGKERRARTPRDWTVMYEKAMAEKREVRQGKLREQPSCNG